MDGYDDGSSTESEYYDEEEHLNDVDWSVNDQSKQACPAVAFPTKYNIKQEPQQKWFDPQITSGSVEKCAVPVANAEFPVIVTPPQKQRERNILVTKEPVPAMMDEHQIVGRETISSTQQPAEKKLPSGFDTPTATVTGRNNRILSAESKRRLPPQRIARIGSSIVPESELVSIPAVIGLQHSVSKVKHSQSTQKMAQQHQPQMLQKGKQKCSDQPSSPYTADVRRYKIARMYVVNKLDQVISESERRLLQRNENWLANLKERLSKSDSDRFYEAFRSIRISPEEVAKYAKAAEKGDYDVAAKTMAKKKSPQQLNKQSSHMDKTTSALNCSTIPSSSTLTRKPVEPERRIARLSESTSTQEAAVKPRLNVHIRWSHSDVIDSQDKMRHKNLLKRKLPEREAHSYPTMSNAYIHEVRMLKIAKMTTREGMHATKFGKHRRYLEQKREDLQITEKRLAEEHPDRFHDLYRSLEIDWREVEQYGDNEETKHFAHKVGEYQVEKQLLDNEWRQRRHLSSYSREDLKNRERALKRFERWLRSENDQLFKQLMRVESTEGSSWRDRHVDFERQYLNKRHTHVDDDDDYLSKQVDVLLPPRPRTNKRLRSINLA